MFRHGVRPMAQFTCAAARATLAFASIVATVWFAAIAGAPGPVAADPQMAIATDTPFSRAFMDSLMAHPAFAARAKALSSAGRRNLAMTLAARGVRRLADDALVDRATRLSGVLDRLEDSLCIHVAVGAPLTSGQWTRVLEAMSDLDSLGVESDGWSRTLREAIVAELSARPVPKADPLAAAGAMQALRGILTDGDRARFDRAWQEGGTVADFAAALRLAYRQLAKLPPSDRGALLRLLVAS